MAEHSQNPKTKTINLALGNGLSEWERAIFEGILARLGAYGPVRSIASGEHRSLDPRKDILWVVSSAWEIAARTVPNSFSGTIFLSPLSAEMPLSGAPSVEQLFSFIVFQRFRRNWSQRVRFLVHSPFAQRFFAEIENIDSQRLSYFPLPLMGAGETSAPVIPNSIGYLGNFESDTNLPFLMSVLHYVHRCQPDTRFLFCGKGRLEKHLRRSLDSLGLTPASRFCTLGEFSPASMIYTPLRNVHFGPLLFAASRGLATVATEVMGLEQFLEDGRHGLVVSPEHVRPAAELCLRLLSDRTLREQLGSRLRDHLSQQVPTTGMVEQLRALFSGQFSARAEIVAA